MRRRSLVLASALTVSAIAGLSTWTQARQQAPAPSPDRAQDQRAPEGSPFSTLPGFSVVRVTPADKTESYIVITFDSQGRPVVGQSASGSGSHPRTLIDANGDGIFEAEKIISEQLNTCHGLFFEGRTLYANCFGPRDVALDGPAPAPPPAAAGRAGGPGGGGQQGIPGFYRLEDADGDDVYERLERINRYVANGMGDHGPHAIRRGPDGTIVHMIGNNTFIPDTLIDEATTPNFRNLKERQFLPAWRDPRFGNSTKEGIHGPLIRYQPENRKFSLQYTGLRNAYDFAYNISGEAFTFDSDMEWDVNAPWFREINTKHMIPGGDGGYRNGTGKFQNSYFDVLPAIRHLRRGSPVGVETYQAYAYPTRFFDNLFEADWSRGRLLYTALTPNGATYTGREDLAEFVHGEPMPITDLEVAPDGNIYFTTGGANGTGGLYKIVWNGARPTQPDMTGILAVVRQPQPLSSWGWAAIEAVKARMGAAQFGAELEKLARSASAAPADRVRAILEMQRHGAAPSAAMMRALVTDSNADVRAAIVYVAGVQNNADARAVAAAALRDASPVVTRRAAESLVRQGLTPSQPSFAPIADIYALLGHADPFVRYSGRLALEHTPRSEWAPRVLAETNLTAQTEGLLALANTRTSEADLAPVFDRIVTLMRRTNLSATDKTRVLRVFQVAATETSTGVSANIKKQVYDALINQFPARAAVSTGETLTGCQNRHPDTNQAACDTHVMSHHMARVLAYTGEPGVISKVLAVIPDGDNDQPGQIGYMYALRMIDGGWSDAEKKQMIAWFGRASKWRGGSTFAGHLNNIFDASVDALTEAEKQMAYAAAPLFAPLTIEEVTAAAGRGGRGGGGGRAGGAPALPATARQVPINSQERYDNLVFPRGSGPGSLAGRGGAPNPTAGMQTFQESCAGCHRFGTTGNNHGPNLSSIGKDMLRRDILRHIFFPDERVADRYQTTVLALKDGSQVRGLVIAETPQTLTVVTAASPNSPSTIQKTNVATRNTERESIMPQDLPDRVGDQNIANVVAFLMEGPR
ncbi:MAG: c-type cytochrome [Acidobacteria bacterium]|nr:c-type cytochrome [Acidobacteriota bacterium]